MGNQSLFEQGIGRFRGNFPVELSRSEIKLREGNGQKLSIEREQAIETEIQDPMVSNEIKEIEEIKTFVDTFPEKNL